MSVSGTPTITAVDGNGTSYTLPANTATVSGNNLTVDPTKLNGLDDGESVVITVTYNVSDGTATTQNTATVTVTGANDAPVVQTGADTADAADDTSGVGSASTDEDTDKTFAADDFNFYDIDNDALSSVSITALPTDGKILIDGVELTGDNLATLGSAISKADIDAGKLIFRPDADESGTGLSLIHI